MIRTSSSKLSIWREVWKEVFSVPWSFCDMLSCCQIMIDSVRNVLWRSDRDLNTISWRIHVTRKCQLSHNMSLQANDCNIMDSVVILIQNDRMSQYYAVVGNQFSLWRARLSVDSRLCWWKVGLRYAPVSWSWFKHPHKLPTGELETNSSPLRDWLKRR